MLKTFLNNISHLSREAQFIDRSLKHDVVAVHKEQALSPLCILLNNMSHALHMYLFSVEAFMFIKTLKCPEPYRR
jgi:hypothetical protein